MSAAEVAVKVVVVGAEVEATEVVEAAAAAAGGVVAVVVAGVVAAPVAVAVAL